MSTLNTHLSTRLQRELLADRIGADEPGMVIAAYCDGAMVAAACAGVEDTRTGAPLTEHSLMNIASVSKQVVSATILIAAKHGHVDLDADVRALVPELSLPGITLRHCLQHTAGLPDYLGASERLGIPTLEIAALDGFLRWLTTVDRADCAPGQAASYSNTGFVIAALATERAVGAPFPELIAETVLRPLGMQHSLITTVLGETVPHMSISFSPNSGSWIRHGMGIDEVAPERGVNGDGELLTSLVDFAGWHGFLLDGRVLGADIRSQLLTRAVLADGRVSSYAMGIEHERNGNTTVYSHSGSMWGYTAFSLTDPVSGIGIAVFANRDDLRATETAWRALRIVTGEGGVAGTWFSEHGLHGVRLRVLGNGDLELSDGEETERLPRDGAGRWTTDGDLSLVELVDGHLEIALEFGLRQRFGRIGAATPHPAEAVGAYHLAAGGHRFSLEDRSGELWLVPPRGEAVRVSPFGTRAGEWIGQVATDWLLIDTAGTGSLRYGSGQTWNVLDRDPASGPAPRQ